MEYHGYTYKKKLEGIKEYILNKNGLRVLLLEDSSFPIIGSMITYHVGSRNEATGYTGATHLLEHLMFKGSKNFNSKKGNDLFVILENIGAVLNATTWLDRTNYYAIAHRDHIETIIAPEADRMRNAFITEKDRITEMPVVRSEFEIGENNSLEPLDKEIWSTAYIAHPYHHSTIGWRSDIENVSIERLNKFYNTYYWPNNATLSIVGDFKTKDVLKLIQKHFGKIPKSPHDIPEVYTKEPKQTGPRFTTVQRSGNTNIVGVANKIPYGLHEDTYALQVLSIVLGDGKGSRLHKIFVDSGNATKIMIENIPFHDNSLFVSYVFLTSKIVHRQIENKIKEEYEKIKKYGITKKELDIAKAKIKSEYAFGKDGVQSILNSLNHSVSLGDWTFAFTFLKNINKVKISDVQKVANKYLTEESRTSGYFIGKQQKNVNS